jgi:hypothetical protein
MSDVGQGQVHVVVRQKPLFYKELRLAYYPTQQFTEKISSLLPLSLIWHTLDTSYLSV